MNAPRRIGAALLAGLGLLTAACGGSAPQGGGGSGFAKGGTFTAALSTDPGNLDPLQSVLVVTGTVDVFLYDSLVFQRNDGKIVSGLAKQWKVTPDSVTFTLRDDVTCSDGTKVTPKVVAANFEYLKDPKNASPLVGVAIPSNDFTVKTDDAANTFTITMAQPFGFLLQGAGSIPIVCPKGTADRGLLARGSDGTGPFTVSDSVAGDHYTLKKRPGYHWGPAGAGNDAPGFPDQVTFKIIQNQSTAANLLLSGGLNAAGVVGPDEQRLKAAKLGMVSNTVLYGELWYNEAAGHPGADESVRKALSMALDLPQVGKVATGGSGTAPTGLAVIAPRACPGNTVDGNQPKHDPSAAAKLLDEAGWKKGADGIRSKGGQRLALNLLAPADTDQVAAAVELVAQTWKKLGADVSIKTQTDTALNETIFKTGNWDAGWLTVNDNLPSVMQGFVSGPVPPQGTNFAHIQNQQYEQLSGRAVGTPGDAGCKLWDQAEVALFKRMDVVPVVNNADVIYLHKAQLQSGRQAFEPTTIRLLA